MKIQAELFGTHIGKNNNLKKFIELKEAGILLTFSDLDGKVRFECIVNAEESQSLVKHIEDCFVLAKEHNYTIL